MKIYKPILISSAQHAEQLPIGTIATTQDPPGGVWRKASQQFWRKASRDPSTWTNEGIANTDAALVALVPIEAEEETYTVKTSDGKWHFGNGNWTRLVTSWEPGDRIAP